MIVMQQSKYKNGRGLCRHRPHQAVKYERVYLSAYNSVSAARTDIADYLDWYNTDRPHSSLDQLTPQEKPQSPGVHKSGNAVQTNGATSYLVGCDQPKVIEATFRRATAAGNRALVDEAKLTRPIFPWDEQ